MLARFRLWEIALILLALIMLLGSVTLYVSNFPLRKLLLGWEDDQERKQVAVLTSKTGNVRRKYKDSPEFNPIDKESALFNFDTIVTIQESNAKIELEDGSAIELGQNTMITLEFETSFTLGGIQRAPTVNVVSGNVTPTISASARAEKLIIKTSEQIVTVTKRDLTTQGQPIVVAPPAPEKLKLKAIKKKRKKTTPNEDLDLLDGEAPFQNELDDLGKDLESALVLLSKRPQPETVFRIPKDSPLPKTRVDFSWEINRPDAELQLIVRRLLKKNGEQENKSVEILKELAQALNGHGQVSLTIEAPGKYEWELKSIDEEFSITSEPRSSFSVEPFFEAIEIFEPLVSGENVTTNIFDGRHLSRFDVTFSWKSYSTATDYSIEIFQSKDDQVPIMTKKTSATKFTIDRKTVLAGTIYYRIKASLPSGFTVYSARSAFSFDFLPPMLVLPKNKAVLTSTDIKNENNKILFTWQKTNFTESYEIEISTNSAFTSSITKQRTKENFILLPAFPKGSYWWRVRSVASTTISRPSPIFELTLN